MPPKKAANKTPATPKNRQEISAKKKPLQLKPKLKTPSIIKVKLKKNSVNLTNVNDITSNSKTAPKLTKKQLLLQKNIDLANEVARAQLVTEFKIKLEPEPDQEVNVVKKKSRPKLNNENMKVAKKKSQLEPSDQQKKVVKKLTEQPNQQVKVAKKKKRPEPSDQQVNVGKKRGRKKVKPEDTNHLLTVDQDLQNVGTDLENPDDVPDSLVTASNDSEAAFEIPQKKKRGRKSSGKSLKKSEDHQVEDTVKEENKTPQSESPVPKKRKWAQSKITDLKILFQRKIDNTVENKKKNVKTVKVNTKPKLVRTMMTRGKRNNFENTPSSECQSPSILDRAAQQPNDTNVTNIVAKKEINETETCQSPSLRSYAVESRKTSMTSTPECMSWAKDISSSNTTTCITESLSDFVIMNNMLPTLKLTDIRLARTKNTSRNNEKEQSLTDSESSDESTKCTSNRASVIPEVDCHSLNLSTSSISNAKSIPNSQDNNRDNTMNDSISKLSKVIDILSSNLKKIDLEIINWIGYPNEEIDFNCDKIKEEIFKLFEEETNLLVRCRHIERVLSDDVNEPVNEQETTVEKECTNEAIDEDKFVKPSDIILTKNVSNSKTPSTEKCRAAEHSRSRSHSEKVANYSYEDSNNFTSNNLYTSDLNCDDDDALSLFAESITGMESSRRNSTMGSPPHMNTDFEEYVPQPVIPNIRTETTTKRHTYNPTKIVSDENEPAHSVKTICEKQNADSTSIYKDSNDQVDRPSTDSVENFDKFLVPYSPTDKGSVCRSVTNINNIPWNRGPTLFVNCRPQPHGRSLIFKGICFYNMITACNKGNTCWFSHVRPTVADIKAQLSTLNNDQVLFEYIFIMNWKHLRGAYGPCFIEECKIRHMTRPLIEMVIDIIVKTNTDSQEDTQLKLHILEYSLLYLNTINLNTVEGLLMFNIKGTLLCDMYMLTLANTQNFSRFKSVFINLTQFIIDHGKNFISLDIATQFLERIAILPYEESVAMAMIKIIECTEPVIFDNSMMGQFENQLSASNLELYRTLLSIKDRVSDRSEFHVNVNKSCVNSPQLSGTNVESPRTTSPLGPPPPFGPFDKDQVGINPHKYSEKDQRYTSPDTTHLDNMGKSTEEPKITRTINFDLSKSYTTPSFSGSNSSGSPDNFPQVTPKPTTHFQRWKGRGNYRFRGRGYFVPASRGHAPRGQLKRPMDRQVTYGNSPSKFPRRSGPDFF